MRIWNWPKPLVARTTRGRPTSCSFRSASVWSANATATHRRSHWWRKFNPPAWSDCGRSVADAELPPPTRLAAANVLGTKAHALAFAEVLGLREELDGWDEHHPGLDADPQPLLRKPAATCLREARIMTLHSLSQVDPRRTYPLLARWSATETDPYLRTTILNLMQRLESTQPDLKRQTIRLRPE